MKYEELSAKAKNGDVFLVQGRGLVSWLIRLLTGESITHVAMLVRDGLHPLRWYVVEMREFRGYQRIPAREWLKRQKGRVWFGVAPELVGSSAGSLLGWVSANTGMGYSYRTLARVWLSQLIGIKVPGRFVCSTYVQRAWEACGVKFDKTADPGDIWAKCPVAYKVTA